MSKTETLGQRRRKSKLALKTLKAQKAEQDHLFEISLFDSFKERVEAGEFSNVDHARRASALVFDVDPSQETKDALEAFLELDRDWTALHQALEEGLEEAASLEEQWARARAELQSRMGSGFKGNGFAQTFELELNDDGSATLSADAVNLLVKATTWLNKGKIGKLNGYLKATESSAVTLDLVVSNPAKAKQGN